MKKQQQGATMLGMMLIGGLVVFFAIMGIKLVPAYIEYATIRSHVRELARAPDTRSASVRDIMTAFDRRGQIDDISAVSGSDLDIIKEGGDVVISVEYEKRVSLVGNISACIDFKASSE